MAKDKPKTCSECGGKGGRMEPYGVFDPKTGKTDIKYKWVTCGTCRGQGTV